MLCKWLNQRWLETGAALSGLDYPAAEAADLNPLMSTLIDHELFIMYSKVWGSNCRRRDGCVCEMTMQRLSKVSSGASVSFFKM